MTTIDTISAAAWGPPMLLLLIGTGLFLSVRLAFLPQRKLLYGIRTVFARSSGSGDISPFSALMTSLGATIGTGNIAGVATAFAFGGPGAVFWMWVTAAVGISTGYAEGILAIKYRIRESDGTMRGGPMYALERGLKNKRLGRALALVFSLCAILSALGGGSMVQANAVSEAAKAAFGLNPMAAGLLMTAVCAAVMLGGIRSIAKFSSRLVPFMGLFYIIGGIVVILLHIDRLGSGIANIISAAFTGQAAAGGFAGASVLAAMRYGASRGIFSNETGLGSASIAAAAAKTDQPVRQGLVLMTAPFFDTLVVCTITALVIASTGVWQQPDASGGASMTLAAFELGLPGVGQYVVAIALILFAVTSILGWSFYGERALAYLTGRATWLYRTIYCVCILIGALVPLRVVWGIADIANVMMAIPNLICILCLSGVVVRESRAFWQHKKPTPPKRHRPF